jgi:hypothetical protein
MHSMRTGELASRRKRIVDDEWCTLGFMRVLLVALSTLLPLLSAAGQSAAPATDDYSGMYSFLRDGEYLQLSIEDNAQVSGFISRYGDSEADKNSFVEQFFESGKLNAGHLNFTTKKLNGTWFVFDGTIGRGTGKTPDDEAYTLIQGTLTRFKTGPDKNISGESQKVEFKSFPKEQ